MPLLLRIIIGCLLFAGSGCRPPVPSDSDLSPTLLLRRVQSQQDRLFDFRGSATVAVRLNGQSARTGIRILYRQPDQFRIDIQGGFMQILAILSIQGRDIRLYYPNENVVFDGTLYAEEAILPGLDFSLRDMKTIALGLVNIGPIQTPEISAYERDGRHATITVKDGNGIRTLRVDASRNVAIREEEQSVNGVINRSFDGYTRYKGLWRPGRIKIINHEENTSLELVYNTQAVNTDLEPSDMAFPLPPTVERLPLEAATSLFIN